MTRLNKSTIPARVKFQRLSFEHLEQRRLMAYDSAIMAAGPALYWQLDEPAGSTVAQDSSPHNRDGSYQNFAPADFGAPGAVVTDKPASNRTVSFDATNNYLSIPASAFPGGYPTNSTPFSVELWFRTTEPGVILGAATPSTPGGAPPAQAVPAMYVDNNGFLRASFFRHGSTTQQNVGVFRVDDGEWHHAVVTYADGTERLYVDHFHQDSQQVSQVALGASANYTLGAGYWHGYPNTSGGFWSFFDGEIDELAIYHRELDSLEIRDHMFEARPVLNTPTDLYVGGTGGDDRILIQNGADGTITVRVNNRTFGAASAERIRAFGFNGNDTITIAAGLPSEAVMFGGPGNDYLVGGAGNDLIIGNDGNDRLLGGGGENQLQGLDGNDTLTGGAFNDLLVGGGGNDTLVGNGGDDQLSGDGFPGPAGRNSLSGGAGNDILVGGPLADLLDGGLGDDLLAGEGGADRLYGRAGHDIIYGGDGLDLIYGGQGIDLLSGDTIDFAATDLVNFYQLIWSDASLTLEDRIAEAADRFDNTTVTDDGIGDQLYGETQEDWFLIFRGVDRLRDKKSTDEVLDLT